MKIDLNPTEMRRLVMILHMAGHVLETPDGTLPTGLPLKCLELSDKLLAFALEGGCDDLIERDHDGSLLISEAITEEPGVMEALIEHDDTVFWRELAQRLAERDYELNTGNRAIAPLSEDGLAEFEEGWSARQEEMERLESNYWVEFERDGIQHLHLMRGTGRPS